MSLRIAPRLIKFRDIDIYVFESKHSPNFIMPTETRDFQKIALIVKGRGFLKTDRCRVELAENQIIFIPSGVPHCFEDDRQSPLTLAVSCFYDGMFEGNPVSKTTLESFKKNFPGCVAVSLSSNFARAQVMNKFRRMIFEQIQRRENFQGLVWSNLVELIIFLMRNYKESQRLLNESTSAKAFAGSIQYLENNYYKPIKVEELASMANMSYRRYTEFFKETKGKTVVEYLTEIRVKYAQKLMLETGNVTYACYEAGFGDLTHFYRVFKKTTELTPKQFIAEAIINTQHRPPRPTAVRQKSSFPKRAG